MKMVRTYRLLSVILTILFTQTASAEVFFASIPTTLDQLPGDFNSFLSDNSPVAEDQGLIFIENAGQFDPATRFQVTDAEGRLFWLTEDAIWITILDEPTETNQGLHPSGSIALNDPLDAARQNASQGVHLRLSFVGANSQVRMEPYRPQPQSVNYLLGDRPEGWHRDVGTWGGVRYVDLYPGIDLNVTSKHGQLTFKMYARSEVHLGNVRLRVEGSGDLRIDQDHILLSTEVGEIRLPLLRLEGVNGIERPRPSLEGEIISSPFAQSAVIDLEGEGQLAFAPQLNGSPGSIHYATYLGGTGMQFGQDIVVDSSGAAYVAGSTYSGDFPATPGAFQTVFGGGRQPSDAFVAKFNADGSDLIYATFLGGSNDDRAFGIDVNAQGEVYVTGPTNSSDFPTTPGAYQGVYGGGTCGSGYPCWDAFVTKLSASGSQADYSTYLGGNEDDQSWSIAVDEGGAAYVGGITASEDGVGWVKKLSASGSSLAFTTLLDGSEDDTVKSVAVGAGGGVFAAGYTSSSDFPTTAGAFQGTFNDGGYCGSLEFPYICNDVFVVKINPSSGALSYATYLGGTGHDTRPIIDADPEGNAYVTGQTASTDFPTTPGALQTSYGGGSYDVFLSKLNGDGSALEYSTYRGGIGHEYSAGIAVDDIGQAFLLYNLSGEIAFEEIDIAGEYILVSTSLGGSDEDYGNAITVGDCSAFVTGYTLSDDFPRTAGAYQTSFGGDRDAYVVKILTICDPSPLHIGFLDLPIVYNNFADAALGSVWGMDDPSRINSWFDHTYPTYAGSPNWNNDNLTRWDDLFIVSYANINDCVAYWGLGRGCYDGHNGLDFSASHFGEPRDLIYAAAPGTVFWSNDSCIEGQSCSSSYGNHLWVDHGNCYATRYGHLLDVLVQDDDIITVPMGQPIGHMGTTGNSQGVHLHFDVFYDDDCDGDWSYESRTAVDPYGWFGQSEDPWDGPSSYLWMNPLGVRKLVTEAGRDLISPSGFIHLTIPSDAVIDRAWVELWDMPAYYKPTYASGMGSTGRGLWLRVPEWNGSSTFQEGLTIQISYDENEPNHLHPDFAEIHRWDEDAEDWVALTTTVDPGRDIATVQTITPGRYELLAPRNIPEDVTEPDDDYNASTTIPTDGTALSRYFDIPEDEDWFALNAVAGMVYEIETVNLAPGVGTVMELYDQDGFSILLPSVASVIEGESRLTLEGSLLEWQAPYSGTYFIRVYPAPGSIIGAESTYQLVVHQEARIYLPLIQR